MFVATRRDVGVNSPKPLNILDRHGSSILFIPDRLKMHGSICQPATLTVFMLFSPFSKRNERKISMKHSVSFCLFPVNFFKHLVYRWMKILIHLNSLLLKVIRNEFVLATEQTGFSEEHQRLTLKTLSLF